MKTVLTVAVLSTLGLAAGIASAADYGDVATVISATPIVERVSTPRRECYTEQVTSYDERRVRRPVQEVYVSDSRPNSGAGTLLGAIIGGVVGHQFGNSTAGRDHGTVAGAVVGGLIGNSVERDNGYNSGYRRASSYDYAQIEQVPVTRDVQRCDTVPSQAAPASWDVTYNFRGQDHRIQMANPPGPTVTVNRQGEPRA